MSERTKPTSHCNASTSTTRWLGLLALLIFATPAAAEVEQPTAPASRATRIAATDLDAPVALELPGPVSVVPLADVLADDSLHLRLPAPGPDGLELRLRVDPLFTVYLSADLDNPGLARLDDIDGETYFAVGVELHVTRRLCVFVEDYQAAGMVLGDEELIAEPAPDRTWDGHQVSLGVRSELAPGVAFEGAGVGYVQSLTGRAAGLGARLSVSFAF